jgi:tRNA pseudouridine38-40 synthase
MRNIRLLIQYDGTAYHGWQTQPNGVTIQGQLEGRLENILGEKTPVTGAGRTDAGVHALAQCACFNTNSRLSTDTLREALNAGLPADIRILTADEADESFHARFSATGKTYIYIISTSRITSPFLLRYVWRLPYRLDIEAMRNAAASLLGHHDFSAFRGSGCGAKTTLRTLRTASVDRKDDMEFMAFRIEGDFIVLRFEGDAFLRHMVRNMVGSLVEVGRGKMKPADIADILAKGDRNLAGPTAPAQGLFLEQINYA